MGQSLVLLMFILHKGHLVFLDVIFPF